MRGSPIVVPARAPPRVARFQRTKTAIPVVRKPSRAAASGLPVDRHRRGLVEEDVRRGRPPPPVEGQQRRHPQAVERVAGAEQDRGHRPADRRPARGDDADQGELGRAGEDEQRQGAGLEDAQPRGDADGAEADAVGPGGDADGQALADDRAPLLGGQGRIGHAASVGRWVSAARRRPRCVDTGRGRWKSWSRTYADATPATAPSTMPGPTDMGTWGMRPDQTPRPIQTERAPTTRTTLCSVGNGPNNGHPPGPAAAEDAARDP